jgi:hypothetical protein
MCAGSGQRVDQHGTQRVDPLCSVPSKRLLSAHGQTQIMCYSHSSAQEASALLASAPHRQLLHSLRCGRRTGAERSPNWRTGMAPSGSGRRVLVLEPCWSWVSMDA